MKSSEWQRVVCLKCQRCVRGGTESTFHENIHVESWNLWACSHPTSSQYDTIDLLSLLPLPPFNSCFLCFFILSCVAPIYSSPSPLPLFVHSLFLSIPFALPQSFPVINIAICASANAAQNRLLMPQMHVMVSNKNWSALKHIYEASWLCFPTKAAEQRAAHALPRVFKEWPSLSRTSELSINLMSSLAPPSPNTPPPF